MEKITEESIFSELETWMWSDGWQISGDEIWFTSIRVNALFRMNRKMGETVFVSQIPAKTFSGFRQHPICVKQGDIIFCLPSNADEICCYHITDGSWKIIEIINPDGVKLQCVQAWCIGEKLYIISIGLKQVIELDVSKLCIDNYYDIVGTGQRISFRSVCRDACIYTVQNDPVGICRFDCRTKERKVRLLPQIEDEISRVEFDGRKFWLGGKKKSIYVWEKDREDVKILRHFPNGFGIYDFVNRMQPLLDCNRESAGNWMFIDIKFIGSYIWMIPCDANEIVYVDIDTLEMKKFPIDDEKRTQEEMEEPFMRCMYIVDYVREERYLGIFSLKHKWIYEIDTKEMVYKILDCRLDKQSFQQIQRIYRMEIFLKKTFYREQTENTVSDLIEVLTSEANVVVQEHTEDGIGRKIYENMCREDR